MSTSHETHHTPSAEIPDELKGLTLENVERMRGDQFVDLRAATLGKSSFIDENDYITSRDGAFAAFEEKRGNFLDAQGIDENHPQREEYMEYLRNLSIDKIPDGEWYVGPTQSDGTHAPSGRDRTREAFADLVGNAKSPDTSPTSVAIEGLVDQPAAKKIIEDAVDESRKHFAELLSKRTTKMFESKKKSKEIDDTYEEFTDYVSSLATEMWVELKSKGVDDDTIRTEIDKFTDKQVDVTVSDVEAERASEFTKRSPMMKRFLNTWASWGGNGKKLFSKDRFKGNVKKGIMVGLPTAGIVALAAPAIGAIGAGAVLGAGIIHIARSTARRLANNKLDATANSETIAQKQSADMRSQMELMTEGSSDTGLHDLLGVVKERSERYRKRNRNRLFGAIAIAATVDVVVGATIGNALTDSDIKFGKAGEFINDKAGDIKRAITGNKAPEAAGGRDMDTPGRTSHHVVPPKEKLSAHRLITHDQAFDGSKGTTHLTAAGKADFNKWVDGHKVKHGESLWKLGQQWAKDRGFNQSIYDTDAVKDFELVNPKLDKYVDGRGWLNEGDILDISK